MMYERESGKMKKRLLTVICPAIALITELFPFAGSLSYDRPLGDGITQKIYVFSYIDPQYWCISPMLLFGTLGTAVITLAALVLSVIYSVRGYRVLTTDILITAAVGMLASLLLMTDSSYYSAASIVVSAALACEAIIAVVFLKKGSTDK